MSIPDAGPSGEELVMPGMEFMMQCYEDELKHPIRNLVSGQLARSLLIQVHSNATSAAFDIGVSSTCLPLDAAFTVKGSWAKFTPLPCPYPVSVTSCMAASTA